MKPWKWRKLQRVLKRDILSGRPVSRSVPVVGYLATWHLVLKCGHQEIWHAERGESVRMPNGRLLVVPAEFPEAVNCSRCSNFKNSLEEVEDESRKLEKRKKEKKNK